jgi:hypothetical protein
MSLLPLVMTPTGMPMPRPRGPMSRMVGETLAGRSVVWPDLLDCARVVAPRGVVTDEDFQISVLMLYELHYRGIIGVGRAVGVGSEAAGGAGGVGGAI